MQRQRRRLLATLSTGAAGLAFAAASRAQFRVEITGVGGTQIPIAIGPFRDESLAGQAVADIIRADLERSGRFRVVAQPDGLDERSPPMYADWRARGADALIAGSVARLADGRVDLRYKLWDVVKTADQGGQAMAVPAADLRLAAHRAADALYEKLTGERGVFATRIAYVTRAGSRYTLRITDADGEGGQVALASPQPIISPAWSPDGRALAYVSFESGKAVVWVQDVATGERRPIANFRGSNSAPAFAPDGRSMAATLTLDGPSQLYLIDLPGLAVRRMTQSPAIDTEAVFSPDGRQIYFVSDRGGGPQVYRMPAVGGTAERVTFQGSYNISPAISPDGRTMAFITRNGSAFKLATMDLEAGGGTPTLLTETLDDESPSFAPNGRLIIYASRSAGRDVLMTTTLDGKIKSRLLVSGLDVREPTWGPYGR
ncbi:MAG: Tol-Pal system beta propeller repeat protein TolB [Aquabacterium sp.]